MQTTINYHVEKVEAGVISPSEHFTVSPPSPAKTSKTPNGGYTSCDGRGTGEIAKPSLQNVYNSLSRTLSYDQALGYARFRIAHYPLDALITFAGLFKGRDIINERGMINNRVRGMIARQLQAERLITPVGVTTEDQERRHYGLATKWRVISN